GFGIARPMPAAALPGWISGFRPDPAWAQAAAQHWRREDLPLLVVGIDHKRWISDLESALDNPALELDIRNYTEPAFSRFGQWYYGLAQELYGDWDEFSKLGGLHEASCRLAAQIVAARQRGEAQGARRDLWPKLLALGNELIACLSDLQCGVAASRPRDF
ncbi:MAG: hypothetical protein EG825_14595, partial [Rhodocyclaceae bacterium]|nr:hypothetical protein [Rhodocyclaceae bacterium]